MTKTIKIFGERNTSTNVLKALIEKNSDSRVAPLVASDLDPSIRARVDAAKRLRIPHWVRERMIDSVFSGCSPLESWKHTKTSFSDVGAFSDVHVVFCVRHPASWVLGLYRRPYQIGGHQPDTLAEFLEKRWKTVGRERMQRKPTSATELYNTKLASYKALQERLEKAGLTYSVVRHEDFAVDQSTVFQSLAPYLDAPADDFAAIEASTKDRRKTREYYQDYYGNQRWRDDIDSESMARINDEIDWSAVKSLGYLPL